MHQSNLLTVGIVDISRLLIRTNMLFHFVPFIYKVPSFYESFTSEDKPFRSSRQFSQCSFIHIENFSLSTVLQRFSHSVYTCLFGSFMSLKKNSRHCKYWVLCCAVCVHVCVCTVLLDNRIISTGQIAALAECGGRRLSANISVLSPAE